MNALVMTGAGSMRIEDRAVAQLSSDTDVLVRVKAVGVCGSDLHIYHGTHTLVTYPIIPGHEIAGEVVEVGSNVTGLKPGDRVVHEIIQWCGKCYPCKKGRHNVCEELKVTGVHHDGGMQEYMAADASKWHKFGDDISYRQAALIEPYTIGAQVCARGNVEKGDTVLIHGAGPVGLIVLDTAKALGAKVITSEIVPKRLQLAKEFGADYVIDAGNEAVRERVLEYTEGKGPNIVIDAAGLPAVLKEAAEIITPAGVIVSMAFVPKAMELPIMSMGVKELTVVSSRLEKEKFGPVIREFLKRLPLVDKLITHVFPLRQAEEAFRLAAARDPQVGKIVIEI